MDCAELAEPRHRSELKWTEAADFYHCVADTGRSVHAVSAEARTLAAGVSQSMLAVAAAIATLQELVSTQLSQGVPARSHMCMIWRTEWVATFVQATVEQLLEQMLAHEHFWAQFAQGSVPSTRSAV